MVTASEMGKKGGQAKSEAKAAAARKNASKPRGKWVTFVHYRVKMKSGQAVAGCFSQRGKLDLDLIRNGQMLEDLITEELLMQGHGGDWVEMLDFGGMQERAV
jgi:hypothetical protein